LAKSKQGNKMRWLLIIINFVVLITLGFFAKDNLLAELKPLLSPETSHINATLPSMGSIEVAFSPKGGATATIIKAIAEARTSILVSAYSFTSQDIAQALLRAKKRNVVVKVILDKSQISQQYSSSTFFANQGFDLRIDVKHAIYHNKVMIIDDKTVITGSFNFTKAAENKNAENVLIIRNNPKLAHIYTKNWRFHWNQSLPRDEFLKRAKNSSKYIAKEARKP
jgi:phosphatidylserine/phosphatidylglycerophosphate/cardiolipin synthase-like enzyme